MAEFHGAVEIHLAAEAKRCCLQDQLRNLSESTGLFEHVKALQPLLDRESATTDCQ